MTNSPRSSQPHAAVVGAGPAGLAAAESLARAGIAVRLFDRMPAPGRKFLLAGRGGLNLTHSEDFDVFLGRYGAAGAPLRPALEAFPPAALRAWCEGLGEPTFVGTSGRIFPRSFKASPLLRAWLGRLGSLGVSFMPRHRWLGWDDAGALIFATPAGPITFRADATVLALGGASWPRLGSDAAWTDPLSAAGVELVALRPANCGFLTDWSEPFRSRFAGVPIKGAVFTFAGRSIRGEAVVTAEGIEGGAIYALSAALREAILAEGEAVLHLALRPDLPQEAVLARLRSAAERGRPSLSNLLRKALKLAPVAIGLLHEAQRRDGTPLSTLALPRLAERVNSVPLRLTGMAPIARAISTAGGVSFDELDASFMLRKKPGVFVAGEMLDWEAPTGGYLLQACFATGVAAGQGASRWLEAPTAGASARKAL